MQAMLDAVTDARRRPARRRCGSSRSPRSRRSRGAARPTSTTCCTCPRTAPRRGSSWRTRTATRDPVSLDELVAALRAGGHAVPLVVLSSCSGAAAGTDGLAAALIRRRRGPGDRHAGPRHRPLRHRAHPRLYRELATTPTRTVAAALADARRAVEQSSPPAGARRPALPRPGVRRRRPCSPPAPTLPLRDRGPPR